MKFWEWVHDTDYVRKSLSGTGPLPVMIPYPQRRDQWAAVLAWYTEVLNRIGLHKLPSLLRQSGCLLVAMDNAGEKCGTLLALRTGRSLFRIRSFNELTDNHKKNRLVFIGLRANFHSKNIEWLNTNLEQAWSVLTASDLPGLSFLVVKTILLHAIREHGGIPGVTSIIDAIDPGILYIADIKHPIAYNGENILSLLGKDHHSLIIRAHGEGSHANLNHVVLCSLEGVQEEDMHGRQVPGCSQHEGVVSCKRVHSNDIAIRHFSELHAFHFVFYSCNGFSVAGELYPSTLSCICSMAEGYIASALTNDRPGSAHRDMLLNAADYVRTDDSLIRLYQLENDSSDLLKGERPWVLFGDLFSERKPGNAAAGTDGIYQVVHHQDTSSLPVFDALSLPSVTRFFAGRRKLYFTTKGKAKVTLADLNAQVLDDTRSFAMIAYYTKAALRLSQQEYALDQVFKEVILSPKAFVNRIRKIKKIREQISAVTMEAMHTLAECRRTHSLDKRLPQLLKLLEILKRYWDNEFADLAKKFLLDGSLEKLFGYGWEAEKTLGEICTRCGKEMVEEKRMHPLSFFNDAYTANCTVCGPAAAWIEGSPRIRLSLPGSARKGAVISVEIEVTHTSAVFLDEEGNLVVSFKDKGTRVQFFQKITRVKLNTVYRLKITLPETLSSELHTCRVLWVSGLEIAYCRQRIALVL